MTYLQDSLTTDLETLQLRTGSGAESLASKIGRELIKQKDSLRAAIRDGKLYEGEKFFLNPSIRSAIAKGSIKISLLTRETPNGSFVVACGLDGSIHVGSISWEGNVLSSTERNDRGSATTARPVGPRTRGATQYLVQELPFGAYGEGTRWSSHQYVFLKESDQIWVKAEWEDKTFPAGQERIGVTSSYVSQYPNPLSQSGFESERLTRHTRHIPREVTLKCLYTNDSYWRTHMLVLNAENHSL